MSKKNIVLFIFCSISCQFMMAQDNFICDTLAIVARNDSVVKYTCNYYFNFFKQTMDSVKQDSSGTMAPVTIVASLKNKEMNGPILYFQNDSSLLMKGFMKNGKADSTFTAYHISLSNARTEALHSNFKNGLKEGEEKEYNENGIITFIRNFKNGLLHGIFKHFDDSGNLLSSGIYKNGRKNEIWTENFLEDHFAVQTKYKNDEIVEYHWTAFYKNGELFYEGNYDQENRKQGIFKTYDTDGFLKSTEMYKKGKRNGYFVEYSKGKPVRKIRYKNDKIAKS